MALLLMELIVVCPVVCGADEVDHGLRAPERAAGAPGGHSCPAHCPDEGGDNCICQGAVESAGVRVPRPLLALDSSLLVPPLDQGSVPSPNRLPGGTSMILLAGGDSASAGQALLQRFRC
jgi:hypothetical protein